MERAELILPLGRAEDGLDPDIDVFGADNSKGGFAAAQVDLASVHRFPNLRAQLVVQDAGVRRRPLKGSDTQAGLGGEH